MASYREAEVVDYGCELVFGDSGAEQLVIGLSREEANVLRHLMGDVGRAHTDDKWENGSRLSDVRCLD